MKKFGLLEGKWKVWGENGRRLEREAGRDQGLVLPRSLIFLF